MLSENFQRKILTYIDSLLVIRLNRYNAAPLLTYYTREEELLLKLGLNYALEKPTKNYLQNLISLSLSGNSLPFTEQEIS
jgi:hypothetical protein